MLRLRKALLGARERCGCNVATSVKDGMIRIEMVRFAADGTSTVIPLTAYGTLENCIRTLNRMKPRAQAAEGQAWLAKLKGETKAQALASLGLKRGKAADGTEIFE